MESFPPARRGVAMATFSMGIIVAPILGPTLGGWITDSFSWRWVFFINVPIGALSLMLSSIIVQDPPFLRRRRGHKRWSIDYIGLGLIALGIGALQVVLDKGERDDWLASRFILVLAVVAVVALVAAVAWEWFHKDPMVDLHLLKDRNFAVSVVLMFMLGVVLFGSTVLLPLFLQLLMGYSATDAGLVLSPGGVVTMAMMPVVGILLSRFEPRWLIVFGLIVVAVSLHMMARFDLQIDYWTAANARMVQGMGLAFLFPPINTAAYAFLPRDKNNQASGLINLARNLGGSFGIAFVATLVARSSQWHQSYLAGHVSAYSPTYQHTAGQIAQALHAQGVTALNAMQMVPEIVYGQVVRQAQMLSYLDAFGILVILFLAMVPLVFLMRKPRHHDGGMAMH
jgi:DHA2 family multidrug resistance protein